MNRLIVCGFLVAGVFSGVGCGHAKVKPVTETSIGTEKNAEEGVVGDIKWVKSKKGAVDMEMSLQNKYAYPVNFPITGFKMSVKGIEGKLHFSKFSGTLLPGGTETALVSFDFKGVKKIEGPAVFTLGEFYNADATKKIASLEIKFEVTRK